MFENIGEKLKLLAKILCGVGIVGSIVVAIIMFVKAGDVPYSQEGMFRALGFVFLIIGPPVSWISSCALYGFGEVINLLKQNVNKQCDIISVLNKKPEKAQEVLREEPKTLLQDIESNLPNI